MKVAPEWNRYPKNKPHGTSDCYVCNEKFGHTFRAIYYESEDVFMLFDPQSSLHPCIEVTHFIELPASPFYVPKKKSKSL